MFLLAKNGLDTAKRSLSQYLTTYRDIKPALTGKALQALGLKPGPVYRTILERLTEARLNGEVHTEEEERALVKDLIARRRSASQAAARGGDATHRRWPQGERGRPMRTP